MSHDSPELYGLAEMPGCRARARHQRGEGTSGAFPTSLLVLRFPKAGRE